MSNRVLKADSLRGLGSKIVFDFEDVQERCEQSVRDARREADEIVSNATREAERIREEAREEARREGLADGLARAEVEITKRSEERTRGLVAEEVKSLLPAVRGVAAALEGERDRWLAHWEDQAIDLAVAIAKRIVHREVAVDATATKGTLVEVLRLVAGSERIEVRLSPDDVDRLGDNANELVATLSSCATADLVPDDSIQPGGCVVDCEHGAIDARIETQLDRIAAELSSGGSL